MTFRLRTIRLEIAGGILLLFAAITALDAPGRLSIGLADWFPAFVSTSLRLAACAVFLAHPLRSSRYGRKALYAFGALVSLASAWWFLRGGQVEFGILQASLGAWLLAAMVWGGQDVGNADDDRPAAFLLMVATSHAALAVLELRRGGAAHWAEGGLLLVSAALLLAGVALKAKSKEKRRLWLAAGGLTGAFASLGMFAVTMGGSSAGLPGAFLILTGILFLSQPLPAGLPESADRLEGVTPLQLEIATHERFGEIIIWVVAAFVAVYVNFLPVLDADIYFVSLLIVAAATEYGFRIRPASAISESRYRNVLFGVVVGTIFLAAATGGSRSPFLIIAFPVVYAGTLVISTGWSVLVICAYAAYVGLDAAARSAMGAQDIAHALLFVMTLAFAGMYGVWTGRRHQRSQKEVVETNQKLQEALRTALVDRADAARRVKELRALNEDMQSTRTALMNVLADVVESKREIEEAQRRESVTLSALREAVIAAGEDGEIFLCNPAAAALLGRVAEGVIGRQIREVLRFRLEAADQASSSRLIDAAYGGSASEPGKTTLLECKDRLLPVAGSISPYFDEQGRVMGVVAALRDVTVEREIDRQKSDFIAIASHQLRTPLSALRWFLDLLLGGDYGVLKAKQRGVLADMSVSTQRMIKLVGDLLDINRIESGRVKVKPEVVKVPEFFNGLVQAIHPSAAVGKLDLQTSIGQGAVTFYGDPSLSYQAINNFLENAVRYTPPGGRIDFTAEKVGKEIVFSVKDTGLGIPKDQRHRVFEKFFRASNAVAKETIGSGLGLYVTKMVADLSGGRVWFESEEGKGSIFHLALPLKPVKGTLQT